MRTVLAATVRVVDAVLSWCTEGDGNSKIGIFSGL